MPQRDVLKEVTEELWRELSEVSTWAELSRKGFEQSHKSEYVLAKIAKEHALRGAISESCAEWVKTGRWPITNAEDAVYLYDRVFYGCAYARFLHEAHFQSGLSRDRLLLWLLVDSWERTTCLGWKHHLENLL